jgi:carboxyl-terminal processing protease
MRFLRGHSQKFTWIGAGAVLGAALSLALTVDANREGRSAIPVDELRTFSEVYSRIKNDYVVSVDDKKLIEQAIAGMVSGLDPHSNFLDESAMKDMRTTTTGRFGGVGIEIGTEDGFIKVVSPIDETPAARAGIRAGDLITKVDGESTRGLTTAKAVERMRGTPGTKVRLEIFRKDDKSTITHSLTREQIKVQAVKAKSVEPGLAFVRVRAFNEFSICAITRAACLTLRWACRRCSCRKMRWWCTPKGAWKAPKCATPRAASTMRGVAPTSLQAHPKF